MGLGLQLAEMHLLQTELILLIDNNLHGYCCSHVNLLKMDRCVNIVIKRCIKQNIDRDMINKNNSKPITIVKEDYKILSG